MHTCIHAYIQTYVHTKIMSPPCTKVNICIHSYIQTYIYIYIHTYTGLRWLKCDEAVEILNSQLATPFNTHNKYGDDF